MPHQCTNCGHLFEDGSQEMLAGCPECDGKKFQFQPTGASKSEGMSESVNTEQNRSKDTDDDSDILEAPVSGGESKAQASARSDVVSPSDLPNVSSWPGEDEDGLNEEDSGVAPEDPYEKEVWEREQRELGLDEIRAELNKQFESIRILAPGEYELNLMELYEREEYIIALQEDGRYMIEVPSYWEDD